VKVASLSWHFRQICIIAKAVFGNLAYNKMSAINQGRKMIINLIFLPRERENIGTKFMAGVPLRDVQELMGHRSILY